MACPDEGYYEETSNHTCLSCDVSCKRCADGANTDNGCSSCGGGLLLLRNGLTGSETVLDPLDSSLTKQLSNVKLGQCKTECPSAGYFVNAATSSCDLCSTGCISCTGSANNQCLSCAENFYFVESSKSCVSSCTSPLVNDAFLRKCTTGCPVDGTYLNTVKNACELCPSNCTKCTSLTTCQGCRESLYL